MSVKWPFSYQIDQVLVYKAVFWWSLTNSSGEFQWGFILCCIFTQIKRFGLSVSEIKPDFYSLLLLVHCSLYHSCTSEAVLNHSTASQWSSGFTSGFISIYCQTTLAMENKSQIDDVLLTHCVNILLLSLMNSAFAPEPGSWKPCNMRTRLEYTPCKNTKPVFNQATFKYNGLQRVLTCKSSRAGHSYYCIRKPSLNAA